MMYLWDTNIAIYYLQKLFPPAAEQFIDGLLKTESPAMSAITEIELLCWKNATPAELRHLKSFISDSLIIELEQSIKQQTADIRKTYNLKLPDAIIAATALNYNRILLTRNVTDFGKVKGLQIFNPWAI